MSEATAMADHNRVQRRYYESAAKPGMLPTGSRYLRNHVDALWSFAGLRPGQRVLEVGCGMGRYTLLLAERGLRVAALDLSPVLLESLRVFAGQRLDIQTFCGDVVDPPAALDGGFDAVVGLFALHHMHDLERCLGSMAGLAAPGAAVAFLEPNPFNPSYYVQMALRPGMSWEGDRGLVGMRRGPLEQAMLAAGLEDFRLERFGMLPPALANRSRGPAVERAISSVLPRGLHAFQLCGARRP